jgi:hypothetical protein
MISNHPKYQNPSFPRIIPLIAHCNHFESPCVLFLLLYVSLKPDVQHILFQIFFVLIPLEDGSCVFCPQFLDQFLLLLIPLTDI